MSSEEMLGPIDYLALVPADEPTPADGVSWHLL